jgi:hypothetical protein
VLTGAEAVADDRVLVDADQAAGLADATALGDVVQDGKDLVGGQAGVEQGRALALGEAGLARLAVEQAAPVAAVVAADGEVAVAAPAEVGAIGVLAAEEAQVVHGAIRRRGQSRVVGQRKLL